VTNAHHLHCLFLWVKHNIFVVMVVEMWVGCFGSVVVNNPSVKLLSVENITDKKLTLGFNTSMPEELGIYQLKDESLEEDGILEFGDTCSLVSEGSEEDYYDCRKRYFITPTSGF
jgi:hypothetical protein